MITIKSDDVVGRVKVYEALVKGQQIPPSSVPESFRVLIKEFQALGLDITVLNREGEYVELKELEESEKDSYLSPDEVDKDLEIPEPEIINEEPAESGKNEENDEFAGEEELDEALLDEFEESFKALENIDGEAI